MVTRNEAAAIAVEVWGEVDYCTEYDTAYVFGKKDHFAFGGPGPVVVLKDSGEVVNMTYFTDCVDHGRIIAEGPIG